MKYVKMLGLLAVAVAAHMALAGAASAVTLTSPTGTTYTSTLEAGSAGAMYMHNSVTTITCNKAAFKGKVEKHGTGVSAAGKLSSLTFSECGANKITVKNPGSLEIHHHGGYNGTVTSTGAEITLEMSLGINCLFTTANTDIGTLSGGSSAKLEFNSAEISRTGHSAFCGHSWTWTASFYFTTPSSLYVDA